MNVLRQTVTLATAIFLFVCNRKVGAVYNEDQHRDREALPYGVGVATDTSLPHRLQYDHLDEEGQKYCLSCGQRLKVQKKKNNPAICIIKTRRFVWMSVCIPLAPTVLGPIDMKLGMDTTWDPGGDMG